MNSYLFKALIEIKPVGKPVGDMFDWLTLQDSQPKKARFLKKPEVVQVEKENLDIIFTNRTVFCPKCRRNETYSTSAQTRSLDEGETCFFICRFCKGDPFKA